MKATKRNLKIYGLIMVLLFELFILPAPEAKADVNHSLKNGEKITLVNSSADRRFGYMLDFLDLPAYQIQGKPKVTSSKKSVATVRSEGYGAFTLIPKKEGTTKIKLTAKINGKNVTRKATVKIVKFKQPFKTLKLGEKNYTKKIKQYYNSMEIKTKKSKIKLNYKLKSGWKVAASSVNKWGDFGQSDIKVKNGTTLSLQANDTYIVSMCLKNKKTKEEIYVSFQVTR